MVEALRGLGYNVQTALADIIDNSIAAGANEVRLTFDWSDETSRISCLDNGRGMTESELDRAMRLGERNPLEKRNTADLGRFGMGLKTASFSQCRRLTVATISSEGMHCLRWDLDFLANSTDDGWHLLEGAHPGSEKHIAEISEQPSGTLVLWEQLDRVVTKGSTAKDFLNLADKVERHLGMVFHRYLEGSKPRLRVLLNDRPVKPWDPFMSGHPSKPFNPPPFKHPSAFGIEAECHVLPHKDRLTPNEFDNLSGPEGWTAQQGFYVYRNERLLVAGSWLGLGSGRSWTKDEAHRLARIRLDIPNSADADWKIDIRKSTARPPVYLRSWLTMLAEETRNRARRAFAHRGKPTLMGNRQLIEAWKLEQLKNGIRYRIDSEHPAVRAVLDEAGLLLPQIKAMLRVIEETVPVQRIWIDTAENKDTPATGFDQTPSEEVIEILEIMYRCLVKTKGYSPESAKAQLRVTEPFHAFPSLVDSLPENI
ncbi:ATP-binding protein [Pseudomonas peradeniyensis]|uniref:ATP-binding protein n=1 Tax=Pseudomonas peradeniyensis TaxID=2745488 RepID=UPI0021D4B399|nr:ATP-binding protein [Pseudomonas peradeniyensis]MCU7281899.1 ATP-binding protein [Pseudomonas peradeniyensis]